MKLVYAAHPYGGSPENAEAVKQIIEDLTGWESSVIGESHGADDSHGTSGACTYQHNHDRSYAGCLRIADPSAGLYV